MSLLSCEGTSGWSEIKMKYYPQIHHRRSIRLKGYDYSQEGAYYITICCHDRKHFFGRINNRKMKLNSFGKIAHTQWEQLPERFPNIELDEFQIMPNHMHGIIVIAHVGAPLAGAQNTGAQNLDERRARASHAPTVGEMIGAYKSIVADKCLELWKSNRPDEMLGKLWQRNFFEHIIRDEHSLNNIREYIVCNPENWERIL